MKRILILGGGFGGIRCALDIGKKLKGKILAGQIEITLIDKKGYHLFVPALYEVASAYGIKKDPFAVRLKKTICIPYSDIFSADKGVNFIQAEVFSIDLENKKVATRGGEILDYDYLVIALGGQAADFGIPGVKEYAFQFKSLEDGLALNQKLEQLTKEITSGVRQVPIKIAVVGAGFTGIELAAELACCIKKLFKSCNIKGKCERVILLEARSAILPMVSGAERNIILKRLTVLGIEVMENSVVEEVGSDCVKLKNGKRLETDLIIWSAGMRPIDLLEKYTALLLTEKKKIKVDTKLRAADLSGVFALGDSVEFIDPKTLKPVPALAYVAVDQGKVVAKNIINLIKGARMIDYSPFYSAWIAPVGGKYALAHIGGRLLFKGLLGWLAREIVDFRYMVSILSFKNAVFIMWQEINVFIKND